MEPPGLSQTAFPCPWGAEASGTPPWRARSEVMGGFSPGRQRWLHTHPHLLLQLLKPQSGDAPGGGPEGGLGTTPRPLQSVPGHLGVQGGGTAVGSGNLLEEKDGLHQPHYIGLAAAANPHQDTPALLPHPPSLCPSLRSDLLASQGKREG